MQWLKGIASPGNSSRNDPGAAQQTAQQRSPISKLAVLPSKPDPILEHLLRSVRSAHVRRIFFGTPASQYTTRQEVTVLTGTYNVGGKKPPEGLQLHAWLAQQGLGGAAPANANAGLPPGSPDIIAVGFQEVVPLSAGNVIAGPTNEGADAWDRVLAATLNGEAWAARNFGRTYGSRLPDGSQFDLAKLGSQAAYAYSVVSNQATYVLGAMDKMWGSTYAAGGAGGAPTPTMMAGAAATEAADRQARLIAAIEDEKDDDHFIQVACKQLVGVYVSVWARRRVAKHIRGVQAASVATGFGGYLGNKGAVAVRLRVYDSPLCLLVSHLASGDQPGDEEKRNSDANDITRRLAFATEGEMAAAGVASLGPGGLWGEWRQLAEHGNVIWLGDLNYRINASVDEARRLLQANQLDKLLAADQLNVERAAGRAFKGWEEGAIAFQPTYKYHLGCNVLSCDPPPAGLKASLPSASDLAGDDEGMTGEGLIPAARTARDGRATPPPGRATPTEGRDTPSPERREKQKKRTPAWCDRILWLPSKELRQVSYTRAEVMVSDHRPVTALFVLEAHTYSRSKVEELLEAARRQVDMSEMAHRPKCALEPNVLDIGLLQFGAPRPVTIALRNMGTVEASFMFIAPPRPRTDNAKRITWDDDQPLAPPWLSIAPQEGAVEPGKDKDITLAALVSGGPGGAAASLWQRQPAGSGARGSSAAGAAGPASSGPVPLDAILILRITDGSDLFCAVSAAALPSAWGLGLDALAGLGNAPALDAAALGEEGTELAAQAEAAGSAAAAAEAQHPASLGAASGRATAEDACAGGSGGAGGEASSLAQLLHQLQLTAGDQAGPGPGSSHWVPKEITALTSFLAAAGRLATPGLFVHSYEVVCGQPLRGRQPARGSPGMEYLLSGVAGLRWTLDLGRPLPAWATPHQATAALLSLFAQLPDSFMPPAVVGVCAHHVPPAGVMLGLLSDSFSPVEWATLQHCLVLLRAALHPDNVRGSGLTLPALAAALAPYWFPGAVSAVPPEVQANRVTLIMALLDPAAPGVAHDQQQQLELPAEASLAAAALGLAAARGTHSSPQPRPGVKAPQDYIL